MEREESSSSSEFVSELEEEAFFFWRDQMVGAGITIEKINRMIRDGIWEKLKRDWTDLYIRDLEEDLGKEHGWLLRKENSEDEIERGKKRIRELEEDVRKWRIEKKYGLESKRAPDIFDI